MPGFGRGNAAGVARPIGPCMLAGKTVDWADPPGRFAMRIAASCSTLVIALLCFGPSCAAPDGRDELRLLDHIAADPLIVMVAGETSFNEVYDGWMEMLGRTGRMGREGGLLREG